MIKELFTYNDHEADLDSSPDQLKKIKDFDKTWAEDAKPGQPYLA